LSRAPATSADYEGPTFFDANGLQPLQGFLGLGHRDTRYSKFLRGFVL
jgi:hypothetical protein